MKFSYKLLKKIDAKIPERGKVLELLTNYSFEAEEAESGAIDVSILPNRYSDAGSHLGIVGEIEAAQGKKFSWQERSNLGFLKKGKELEIKILDKKLCARYIGAVLEIKENKESPRWIQEILFEAGMKPINLIVDVMNYVMLLSGQPMHTFDFEKVAGRRKKKIIVRRAKKGEKIETLDEKKVNLDENVLLIADEEGPLAIAGIKGGKRAEVDSKTRKIIVEAANFEQANIFKTTKRVGIATDASLRFSHNLNAELAAFGMNEALKMIKELAGGKLTEGADIFLKRKEKREIYFKMERFVSFSGIRDLSVKEAAKKLELLGFVVKKTKKEGFYAEPPIFRNDILNFQDLTDEVARIYGINKIKAEAPNILVYSPIENNLYVLKKKTRRILQGFALDEVYNYTFLGEGERGGVRLQNPISADKEHLRISLKPLLLKNIIDNFRFFEKAGIFELGKVFCYEGREIREKLNLGIAIAHKKENCFLELKGIIEGLFRGLGLTDYEFKEEENKLAILTDGELLGRLEIVKKEGYEIAAAEIDFEKLEKKTEEELEYEEIIKYPSIVRDLSFLVGNEARVGEILREIQGVDFQEIRDVDLVDFYEDEKLGDNLKSLTFRIVLQSDKKSLKDEEADEVMGKIIKKLEEKFGAEVR